MKTISLWLTCALCIFSTSAASASPTTPLESVDETRYRYYLSICAVFQDEAPYLKEWIEFHNMMGVEHFYLYNNNSSDHYYDVLLPYMERGVVELVDWPTPFDEGLTYTQECVYNYCIAHCRGETRWLAVIDIDEFIIPVDRPNLTAFLADFDGNPALGGVMIFWQSYGSSWYHKIPPDKLLTECLVLKRPFDDRGNHQVKTICKPHKVAWYHVHGADYKPGYYDITTNGGGGPNQPTQIDRARINHYWTRDEDFFINVKIPRREKWEGRKYTPDEIRDLLKKMNSVEDRIMDRFIPELRKRVFE